MASTALKKTNGLRDLRWRWIFFGLVCAGALSGSFAVLYVFWEAGYAVRWLILASFVTAYILAVLWFSLTDNHRIGESRLLVVFGLGTNLTLARGLLVALLSGFLLLPRPGGMLAWIPGVLYGLAGFADLFDGYFARIEDRVTKMGQNLDMQFDSIGILAAVLLAIQYGQIPPWYILIALARYLYLFGLYLWRLSGRKEFVLPYSPGRRAFAGLQMGFLAVMLLPLFSPPGTYYAAGLIAIPFLIGFARDWSVATGIIHQPGGIWGNARLEVKKWLPVLIRITLPIIYLLNVLQKSKGFSPAFVTLNMVVWFELAVIFFISAGIAGRFMGILGLILLGFQQMSSPLSSIQFLLLTGYVAVIYLGTGVYSLWAPEGNLINRRLGERGT
jgi:CDP-diacylglycerol--glycerol-3-phosphate 3-phosphatidyltransferase